MDVMFYILTSLILPTNGQLYKSNATAQYTFTDTRVDVRFNTKVLVSFKESEVSECLIKCVNHENCKAVNINVQKEKCELLGKQIIENHGNDIENVEGWFYYGVEKVCDKLTKYSINLRKI